MAFPNYTYPAYGAYNPVTPFAPAPQVYQPQQPTQQPSQTIQPQSNVNTQPAFFCRPVASREEALGVPVDFMGAPMFFPDLAHNVVYMKRFNTNTGAADVFEFHGQQQAKEQQAENQSLKLAASQANQNSYLTATLDAQTNELIRRISPSPVPAYQVPNPYTGCCGYNNCGC